MSRRHPGVRRTSNSPFPTLFRVVGHGCTSVVRVENELGAGEVGGGLYERPLDTVLAGLRIPDGVDVHLRDISPASARARLEAALSGIDLDAVMGTAIEW